MITTEPNISGINYISNDVLLTFTIRVSMDMLLRTDRFRSLIHCRGDLKSYNRPPINPNRQLKYRKTAFNLLDTNRLQYIQLIRWTVVTMEEDNKTEPITGLIGTTDFSLSVEELEIGTDETVTGIQVDLPSLDLKWFIHSDDNGWHSTFIHNPDDITDKLSPALSDIVSSQPFWMVFDKKRNNNTIKALLKCGLPQECGQEALNVVSSTIFANALMEKISISENIKDDYIVERMVYDAEVDYSNPIWFMVDKKFSAKAVAIRVAELFKKDGHPIKTIDETKVIHMFHNGMYVNGEDAAERMIRDLIGHFVTISRVKEVAAQIRSYTLTSLTKFDPGNAINMQNGVYRIDVKTFYEAEEGIYDEPDMLFTYKMPVHYDPDATCPEIEKFFNQVMPNDIQREQIYEEFAYSFVPEYPIQKMFMWLGDGGTGKGTAVRIFEAIVGREFVSGWSIEALEHNDEQCHYNLLDKKINICGDLPDKKVPFAWLKSASGGDVIPVKKLYAESFNTVNSCKFLFAMNNLPEFEDFSEGILRRLIITLFEVSIPDSEMDPHLTKKLTTPVELSGFFNILMDSYDNLMEREEFIYNPSRKEVQSMLNELRGEDVKLFISEMCITGKGQKYSRKVMYSDYKNWRASRQAKPKGRQRFNEAVRQLGYSETRYGDEFVWVELGKESTGPTQVEINTAKMSEDLNPKPKTD